MRLPEVTGRDKALAVGHALNTPLALVEAIISAHGGMVTLASRPGDTAIAVHLR